MERLRILKPEVRFDLPGGASRILQGAEGYVATMVSGMITRREDKDTGARPGRLARTTRAA
jgi:N-acyl-D-aspartate/D-glutamate deacylase